MALALSGTKQVGGNNTAQTSFTATLPTGVADGDVVFIVVNVQVTGVTVSSTGWTVAYHSTETGSAVHHGLLWRKWSTGDATTTTVAISSSSAYSYVSYGFSGANVLVPLGTPVHTADSVSDTTANVNAMTTVGVNSIGLIMCGTGSGSTTFTVDPTAYTDIGTGSPGKTVNACYKSYPSPASTGALTYTLSAASQTSSSNVELFAAPVPSSFVTVPVIYMRQNV